MNPILVLGTVNGLLNLLDQLLPVVREQVAKGEISVEQQTALLARIELYRSGKFFDQPQWQVPSIPTSGTAGAP